ncbi:hypothetical protein [Algibacillus agarilyticus]|uniref:hypothetical protein n=1 Tax=Algibacillus agarilyticus TaxID=2234133 RepID=UPI000DCFABAA|nr:hypothetical protein [Algibacillus agarilyticus]
MAKKGNSIAAIASRALGIEQRFLPERLRNRLNYYVKDESLKEQLLDEADLYSEADKYTSRPIRAGNKNFIRNLIILDTLFEDKKLVTNWLNGAEIPQDKLEKHFAEWRAKKMLYQALESRLPELGEFLSKGNIDWVKDEIPYPFSAGEFTSVELIANVITADNTPSPYDSAIKAVINNQFGELGQILDQASAEFVNGDGQWLNLLYQAKRKEYEEFNELLNKY